MTPLIPFLSADCAYHTLHISPISQTLVKYAQVRCSPDTGLLFNKIHISSYFLNVYLYYFLF